MSSQENVYRKSPATGVYGARIWLDMDVAHGNPLLYDAMDKLSKWGGSDKSGGGLVSWELSELALIKAETLLKSLGFEPCEK